MIVSYFLFDYSSSLNQNRAPNQFIFPIQTFLALLMSKIFASSIFFTFDHDLFKIRIINNQLNE